MAAVKSFFFLLVFSSLQVWSKAPNESKGFYRKALEKRLDFIFSEKDLKKTQMSVAVFSLSRQESLYEKNAEKVLSPASSVKLLTGYVALKKLGADYRFKTTLHSSAPIVQGQLEGDLYIKGGGDPSLVSERMFLLVQQLQRHGIKSIKGNIYADASVFDDVLIDPNRIDTDTDRAYNAPVSGLNFNYNTTTVFFRPSIKNKAPHVFIEPDTGFVRLVNKAKTKGSQYKLKASRLPGKLEDKIVVTGSMGTGIAEQRIYFNISNPPLYAGWALRFFLNNAGIRVQGPIVKEKKVPKSEKILAELTSPPLADIVTLMNKFSNNFIADTLVKTLGWEFKDGKGSMDNGLEILRQEAVRIGMNTGGFQLVSGSGLTRNNKISAKQFVNLLNNSFLDFDVLPELWSSMPIAGQDGTLRDRLKKSSAFGRLRAKTGTINSVSSLVGVVQSRGGELLGFAVIMNGGPLNPSRMRPWQNYFAQALADFSRKREL